MSKLYQKVAVASVCTVIGLACGANKEAKAATFNTPYSFPRVAFLVIDGDTGSNNCCNFDGVGDLVTYVQGPWPGSNFQGWYNIEKTPTKEIASLLEYSIPDLVSTSNLSGYNGRITTITNALLSFEVVLDDLSLTYIDLGLFGYSGNGTAEASDFGAGWIDSTRITLAEAGPTAFANFDVTGFLNGLVSNNQQFAGFGLRPLNQNYRLRAPESGGGPSLTVSGDFQIDPNQPVPEPTTIFGSALALGVGGWLKRKKSSQQNKTTPQG